MSLTGRKRDRSRERRRSEEGSIAGTPPAGRGIDRGNAAGMMRHKEGVDSD